VAGYPGLIDEQQKRITVAIDTKFYKLLHLARSLAFAPQRLARAGPVADLAGFQGFRYRLGIHPSHHQYFAGIVLLCYGRHEPICCEGNFF